MNKFTHLLQQFPRDPSERRITWSRLDRIIEWIKSGTYPNIPSMARKLAASERTVTRDIAYLKDERKLPLAYDERRFGFYFTKPVQTPLSKPLTQQQIIGILMAHKSLAQHHGSPFEKEVRKLFKELTSNLVPGGLVSIPNLRDALSYRPFAPEESNKRLFKVVAKGLVERRVLQFHYRNLGERDINKRRIRPYHLTCYDNHWYLFGWDIARQGIRTFVLSRLTDAVVSKHQFPRPRDWDAGQYLNGSFGVMHSEYDYEVVIEFDAWGTDLIRGRRWHRSQELIELPGGGSRLRLRLNGLEEIERTILSWGTHATVLRPKALVERLGEIGNWLVRQYSPPPDAFPRNERSRTLNDEGADRQQRALWVGRGSDWLGAFCKGPGRRSRCGGTRENRGGRGEAGGGVME
jgi:predicted DNA-binding transcriptional regulator YafY